LRASCVNPHNDPAQRKNVAPTLINWFFFELWSCKFGFNFLGTANDLHRHLTAIATGLHRTSTLDVMGLFDWLTVEKTKSSTVASA
jgi:hypothetical protein